MPAEPVTDRVVDVAPEYEPPLLRSLQEEPPLVLTCQRHVRPVPEPFTENVVDAPEQIERLDGWLVMVGGVFTVTEVVSAVVVPQAFVARAV
jgi:hypothetical protein